MRDSPLPFPFQGVFFYRELPHFLVLSSSLVILYPLDTLFRGYEQVGISTKTFEKDVKII